MTADNIDLRSIRIKHHPCIHEMIRCDNIIWNGVLCDIKVAEHATDLKKGPKPLNLAFYRSSPSGRQPEIFELQRQLNVGIIESAESEWASPILLVPKKGQPITLFC